MLRGTDINYPCTTGNWEISMKKTGNWKKIKQAINGVIDQVIAVTKRTEGLGANTETGTKSDDEIAKLEQLKRSLLP